MLCFFTLAASSVMSADGPVRRSDAAVKVAAEICKASRITAEGVLNIREGWHTSGCIRKALLQIGVPALLAFMACNAYLAVNHLRQMQHIAERTLESSTLQADISNVLKDLTDMETGQRGYLLTGNPAYLQPYTNTKGRIGTDFASLRAGMANRADNERSQESQLESLATSKQAEMERTITLRQQGYRGCRQRDDNDTSANCQGVFKYRDSQIRRIAAEPLASVVSDKGPCDGSHSTENRPFCYGSFRNAVDCRSANRARHNARRKRPCLQSTRGKAKLICNQFG